MWKTAGRWTLGAASSLMLTVPALSVRADENQQVQKNASQAGGQTKPPGTSAGAAAQSPAQAAGSSVEESWKSSKQAGDTAAQSVEPTGETVSNVPATTTDDRITSQVKQKLGGVEPTAKEVTVSTTHDVVTLSGSVTSEASRRQAVDIARAVRGVKKVKDHLEVNPSK